MTGSDNERRRPRRPATDLAHAGRDPFAHHGFVNPPVYRGSTVLFKTVESFEKRDAALCLRPARHADLGSARTGHRYARRRSAHVACAVGRRRDRHGAAVLHSRRATTSWWPTRSTCRPARCATAALKRFGVETTYYDPTIGAGIARLMRPTRQLVFTESPGSLTFEVQDIPAIAAVARAARRLVVIDNTWGTPLYFKPFAHGVDISIQAATKYIVGHADAMLGSITVGERLAQRLVAEAGNLGICAGTEEMYLGLRGMRTMERAPGAPLAIGSRDRALAGAAARGRTRDASGIAEPSPARALEARLPRRGRPVLHRAEAVLEAGAGGHARRLRAVRHGGILGRLREASRCPSTLHRPARQRHGSRGDRRCGSISVWRMWTTSRPISKPVSGDWPRQQRDVELTVVSGRGRRHAFEHAHWVHPR